MDELDIDFNGIGSPLTLELFADDAAYASAAKTARAMKTRSKIHARRAKSESQLQAILPTSIEDGDAWHVLSAGDIDSLSYAAHIIKHTPMDHVVFSTWCMAVPDVKQLAAWIDSGHIKRLDAYVGEIFPGSYGDEHQELCRIVRPTNGRVCVFRNHSKIFLCRAGNRAWVIESSANINTNPRVENTVITASMELYRHHLDFFNGVKSFNKDFQDWKPAP